MDRAEKAVDYYMHNFNCSQGVFTAFAAETGFDEKTALKIATNFGGGARKGELCGAVDMDTKQRSYRISEEYLNRFIEANGSVVCRELLELDLTDPEDMKIIKEKNLFRTRCPELVRSAAEILEGLISELEQNNV